MIKLTSLLKEQNVPGLNASLTIPEIAFQSGDYHIPPEDIPSLKAAAKGIIDAYNDPKNQNLQTTLTIEAGATPSEITPDMVKNYWQKSKRKPKTGAENAPADNKLLVRKRAYAVYRALLKHIAANVKFSTKVGHSSTRVGTKSVAEWENIIKYETVLNAAADRKYAKGSIKVTGQLKPQLKPEKEKEIEDDGGKTISAKLKCGKKIKLEGTKATHANNYVSDKKIMQISFNEKDATKMIVKLDPVYIPDAVYWKIGNSDDKSFKQGWTKFAGYANYESQKVREKHGLQDLIDKGYYPEAWTGQERKHQRNFPVELIRMATHYGLVGRINAAIKAEGGTLIVKEEDLFDGYKNVKAYVEKLRKGGQGTKELEKRKGKTFKRLPVNWRKNTMGGFVRGEKAKVNQTIEIPRSADGEIVTFLAFGPLAGTIFKGTATCKSK